MMLAVIVKVVSTTITWQFYEYIGALTVWRMLVPVLQLISPVCKTVHKQTSLKICSEHQ
jgi:hypothetical protein